MVLMLAVFFNMEVCAEKIKEIPLGISAELFTQLHAVKSESQAIEAIVVMQQQASLYHLKNIANKSRKATNAVRLLKQQAHQSQAQLIAYLEKKGIRFRSFWVANQLLVTATPSQLLAIASRKDVNKLYANTAFKMENPIVERNKTAKEVNGIEWHVSAVQAPEAWALGHRGQGVVIAGQDTGYEWEHPALKQQYLGWNGMSVDHNYHWHNAIHTLDGSTCDNAIDIIEPCDDNSHGTHTMGIMVGDDGVGNQVGVAPDARWISCRNMDSGEGTAASYMECFEWLMAPTDLSGLNPDPTKAPDIINNSWGCPPSPVEDCDNRNILLQVVENVVNSGILVVVSAGNNGGSCSTVVHPAAIYQASFSVGSSTSSHLISSFSSRGPVLVDGSGRMKPDITAPGSNVRSSVRNGGYTALSGTSMAAPNIAGVAALILSAHPDLKGNPDAISYIIMATAVPMTTPQNCGDINGSEIPNNTYGWGRVNALAAVQYNYGELFANGFE